MGIDLMDLFLRTLLLTVKNLQIHLDQRVFLWWRYQCLKAKAIVAEVASNLEAVQKENEEKEKGMAKLKEENKRLKQKVNILFEKFNINMAPLQDSESDNDKDECSMCILVYLV